MVEHRTLNPLVEGSSPSALTHLGDRSAGCCPVRLGSHAALPLSSGRMPAAPCPPRPPLAAADGGRAASRIPLAAAAIRGLAARPAGGRNAANSAPPRSAQLAPPGARAADGCPRVPRALRRDPLTSPPRWQQCDPLHPGGCHRRLRSCLAIASVRVCTIQSEGLRSYSTATRLIASQRLLGTRSCRR